MKLKVFFALLGLFFFYSGFTLFHDPQISHSLILLFIGGFASFVYYSIISEIPPKGPLSKEEQEIEQLKIQKELLNIQYDVHKIHSMQNNLKRQENDGNKTFIF